jgi:hypothetical protein
MRFALPALVLLAPTALAFVACAPENTDLDRCGGDYHYVDGGCIDTAATDTDVDSDTDADGGTGGWLGAPCTCEGDDCEFMGMPMANAGTIEGCGGVPLPWTGAILACMRTNASGVGPPAWFANGYCTLAAVDCTGSETVCNLAQSGSYADMTTCPEDSALVTGTIEVNLLGGATLESKMCAPLCEVDGDCRTGETDPLLGDEPSQYSCAEIDGVKFCHDPRNLNEEMTAEAF